MLLKTGQVQIKSIKMAAMGRKLLAAKDLAQVQCGKDTHLCQATDSSVCIWPVHFPLTKALYIFIYGKKWKIL